VPLGGAEVAEATSARVAQVQPAPRQAPGRGRQALHGSAGCERGARRRMRWWRTRAAQPRGQNRPPAARRRGACWRCCCRAALRPSWTRASAGVRTCPGPVCGGLLRQEACPPLAAPAVCPAVSLLCHSCVCCVSPVVVSSVSHRALAVSDTARGIKRRVCRQTERARLKQRSAAERESLQTRSRELLRHAEARGLALQASGSGEDP